MRIGIPTEIKNHEYRIGLTAESVFQLTQQGHEVMVQSGAGLGIGTEDSVFEASGASIGKDAETVFEYADMIVKVKEPLAQERKLLRKDQILFTYLHLAADKTLTTELMDSHAVCIAYETVTDHAGRLPLLAPMSKVAGRLAAQAAAYYLQKPCGGSGKLIGGVPGVLPAKVVVIGGGVVGRNSAQIALGMGAQVTVLEKNANVMDEINAIFSGQIQTLYSSDANLATQVADSDVVIGGILIPGSVAPKIVTEAMIQSMRPKSVIVDVAIDQGGCIETAKATTHADPIYMKHDVIHYCVANMPGAVPHTATYALNNVTLPFVQAIANKGWQQAIKDDRNLRNGLSVLDGGLTCQHSAVSLDIDYTDPNI